MLLSQELITVSKQCLRSDISTVNDKLHAVLDLIHIQLTVPATFPFHDVPCLIVHHYIFEREGKLQRLGIDRQRPVTVPDIMQQQIMRLIPIAQYRVASQDRHTVIVIDMRC